MSYSRIFVALKQGCQEYAKDVRGSVGRCVIELRNGAGRLILQAQGLRSDCDYRVCVLTKDSYAEVTKPLYVDASGKGEVKWEFSPKAINIAVGDIKAVAVLVRDKAPLIGFVEGEYNWQHCLMAKNDSDYEAVPAVAAVVGCSAEDNKKSENTENKNEKEKQEKLIYFINEIDKDIDEIKEYSKIGTPEGENKLFSRECVSPFGNDNICWVKGNIKEICLVRPLWKYINNPFVIKGCREYKHILLGKGNDSYWLAVPGKYDKDYKLEAMAQGFEDFKSTDNKPLEQGDFCYYILKC